ncbi:zinc finger protein ZFP2-like isoform X2 [Ptychodera flava]|uniref:zinc finger protein ZFP2-like isoform X2 n=1 Tax=Ptychodera flava TaxID=63121 RepID=UPI00396A2B87
MDFAPFINQYKDWAVYLQGLISDPSMNGRNSPGEQRKLVGDSFSCSKCNRIFPNAMAQINHEMNECHQGNPTNHNSLMAPINSQQGTHHLNPSANQEQSRYVQQNNSFNSNQSDSPASVNSPGEIATNHRNQSPSPGEISKRQRGRPKNSGTSMIQVPQPVFVGNAQEVPMNREYKCKICPHVYYTKSDMQRHARSHAENKPYKCCHCDKTFANSSYLSQHSRVHTGEKPYQCGRCCKSFKQLSHLQQHTRTHTGEKPYQCTIPGCGKAFSQLANLQQHSRRHNKDKPFKCPHCYRVYADMASLQAHVPSHANTRHDKKYPCGICGKSYTQESYLMKHMLKHPTEPQFAREFICNVCGKKFTQQAYLERHVQKRHANNSNENTTSQSQTNNAKSNSTGNQEQQGDMSLSNIFPVTTTMSSNFVTSKSSKHPILNVPMMSQLPDMRAAIGLMPPSRGGLPMPGVTSPSSVGLHSLPNDPRGVVPMMFSRPMPPQVSRGLDLPLMAMSAGYMDSKSTYAPMKTSTTTSSSEVASVATSAANSNSTSANVPRTSAFS